MSALFDPARHEPLCGPAWSDPLARAAIAGICADALAAFSPQTLWAPHALDDPPTPETRYVDLFWGAGGVIWALRRLAAEGAIGALPSFDDTLAALPARHPVPLADDELGSLFGGDAGLLLLQWPANGDAALADRLFDLVSGHLHHPSLEMLCGHPGSAMVALHLAEATGEPRWREQLGLAVQRLSDTLQTDPETHTPVWEQDLYGRQVRYLGAGHGLAGNVFVALRGAALLDPALVNALTDAALATLQATALRGEQGWNWHPMIDAARVAGRTPQVQDCHGAPGMINRLASAPRSADWDELLTAAGEITWAAGPLMKGPSVCHGTAGNALALLKLARRTGDERWRVRAQALAAHAAGQVERARALHGQGRYSLWTGDLGVAWVLWECLGAQARLPLLDVF